VLYDRAEVDISLNGFLPVAPHFGQGWYPRPPSPRISPSPSHAGQRSSGGIESRCRFISSFIPCTLNSSLVLMEVI
jgi:hypothetical protein